ncbi:MAG: glycosyl hydrolase 115 family protein [Chitinophagaceae bacterium]
MKKSFVVTLCFYFVCFVVGAQTKQATIVHTSASSQPGFFPLMKEGNVPTILVDASDADVVRIAANALALDMELVGGMRPAVIPKPGTNNTYLIIAGTIGKSSFIDGLIKAKKLNPAAIKGKWESFVIATIDAPMKGVQQALVIAGSDRRGTAYGLFELSRAAGVSPWVWWADAVPAKQAALSVFPGTYTSKEPSVKYRGIFINDEDWGLQPWAAKTFEPETGDIGPKTYAKVFELLLRLRANLIWPAMHDCTKPFFQIAGNTKIAEAYGILIGSSHAEPMLRNNVGEWNEKTMGPFNYIINKETVLRYWEDRVKESKGINAMFSLGMRGVHDSKMEGVKDAKEAVPLLENIFADQRNLLTTYINKDIKAVPQVFTAYKEVLEIYDNGLKLPDDVTLVWPDDNYGYIQRLNNEQEKKRPGGSGVYYHASYWGRPHDYLWLSSTHPALIQEEMMKAYDNGSKRLWVLNVGDIKPLEYNIELFMDMGFNASPFKNSDYSKQHLLQWAADLFGTTTAPRIQAVLWEYYQLAFERRPEFMGWSQTEPTTKTNYTAFNHFYYGDEAQKRIDVYQALEDKVKALRTQMLPKDAASFYQLVYYPVVGASLINKKFLYRDKSYFYARQNRLSAADYAQQSKDAYDSIVAETDYFNNQLSGGKWTNMMSMKPRNLPVFLAPELPAISINGSENWGIAPEGYIAKDSSLPPLNTAWLLPAFDNLNKQQYFIDLFLTANQSMVWDATVSSPWIKCSAAKGILSPEPGKNQLRLLVSIDWTKAPATAFSGAVIFTSGSKQLKVAINGNQFSTGNFKGFVESNGYICIQASHFTRQKKQSYAVWNVFHGVGYTGETLRSEIGPQQETKSLSDTGWIRQNSSYVAYDFYSFTKANASLQVCSIPTHPLNNLCGMRYAVSVDGGPIQIVDFRTVGRTEEWKQNVLRNRAEKTIKVSWLEKGRHTLRIYAMDPGVLLDEIQIDFGGLKHSVGAISETRF